MRLGSHFPSPQFSEGMKQPRCQGWRCARRRRTARRMSALSSPASTRAKRRRPSAYAPKSRPARSSALAGSGSTLRQGWRLPHLGMRQGSPPDFARRRVRGSVAGVKFRCTLTGGADRRTGTAEIPGAPQNERDQLALTARAGLRQCGFELRARDVDGDPDLDHELLHAPPSRQRGYQARLGRIRPKSAISAGGCGPIATEISASPIWVMRGLIAHR
jgi:hypothetical protein